MDTNSPGSTGPGAPPEPGGPPTPGDPTAPAPTTAPGDRRPEAAGFFDAIRRLDIQRADDRWIGGVCAGLSNRFGLDPLVWRGILAASVLLGGIGLIVYGLAWALLPERSDGRIHLEETIAGRFDVALLGAAALVVVGIGRGGHALSPWSDAPGPLRALFGLVEGILWLAFIAGIVLVVVLAARGSQRKGAPTGRPGAAPTYGPPPYAGQSYPGQPYPDQPYPGQPYPGQPSSGPAYAAAPYTSTTPYASAPTSDAPAPAGAAAPPQPPQPPQGQRPPRPPAPPRPAKPRVHGPGVATVGVVVALVILTLAALLTADRAGSFTGPVALTTVGVGVVLAGLGIVVAGLRGRSSGVLGFLAIVGILAALPLGAATDTGTDWDWSAGTHRFAGDTDIVVTTRDEASAGFTQAFGDMRIDLSDVPMTSTPLEVPIGAAAGDITVVVGTDTAVTADVRLRAGEMTWDVGGTPATADGVSTSTRTFTDEASRTSGPQLELDLALGAGNITVVREDS